MKRQSVYFVLVWMAYALSGCEHTVGPDKEYYFMVKINDLWWQGDSDADLLDDGRLVIWGIQYLGPGNLDDIVIEVGFQGVGSYSIKPARAFMRTTRGYDMGCGVGVSFGSSYDQVVIKKYDEQKRIVEGTFRFAAKGDNGNPDMRFDNGWFRAIVR